MRASTKQADEKFKKDKFVLSVAFSPDGRRLACGVMDGTVCIFDVPSGKLLHTLAGHHKPVRDVVFTPGAFYRLPQHTWRHALSACRLVSSCRFALPLLFLISMLGQPSCPRTSGMQLCCSCPRGSGSCFLSSMKVLLLTWSCQLSALRRLADAADGL